ncbi:temperature dependent protein affecting M2 dsRNA replication-domain-containing protein [Boeremia exigua]|uniref:temperature dependent protein affecting M2 dsRNA replication-domain-containing protein n=1 Tax=Boeremia exigua TaxID=749465 RepID=UPI001E8CE34E|nr:temperature dependent protein affecting M2 dsRNA replication-domain-containing protein [Boeremia exigua]KAH6642344.1 temperature dependent protein affecting M2 dsRNA replication-domain-containing protein [Boeremia exigua]
MIRDFEAWNANIGELSELQELGGCRVAIEAAHYLQHRILSHPRAREPLVPALGGLPLGMKQYIEEDLNTFESLQIEPWFVFSGLDITKPDDPFQQKQREAGVNTVAWNLYDSNQAEASVAKFGESTYVTPEDLFRFLQSILIERKVHFQIAPYSAWAQLAYLEKETLVHAISGASEVLLFECDKVVTSWNLEDKTFSWTKRSKCIADLERFASSGRITEDVFVDALLLAGTPFLPTLPNLSSPNRTELLKPHGAIKMITMSSGRTGYSVVITNKDDPRFGNYVDRYCKARLAVKNHPIITTEGKVEPLNASQMSADANQFLGQRLSDELHYLHSHGILNSRLLQWRTSCEINEQPPIDGGMSPEYQKLVTTKLTPLRTAALNLLSTPLHHWYRVKGLEQTCWFTDAATGKAQKKEISMRDLPEYQAIAETWNVPEATFREVVSSNEGSGPLGSAILALTSDDFVAKTVAKKDTNNLLSTPDEILYNSLWRFLAVREYVDAKHNLTPWGFVLAQTIASLDGNAELEESAVLAVELLRLEDLNGDIAMFPYNGAPMRGNAKDQHANMLISRVAGLGTLQHKPIGFTGPLSQHLLGYGSVVNLVRQTLRDLVEATCTNMFLTGCCDRKADLSLLITKFPFLLPNNCALGIGVKSYLDELTNDSDPTSAESKARVIDTVSTRYFPQSIDFQHDLRTAFALWDAVFAGVKASGTKISQQNKTLWTETNDWLRQRR